MTRSERSVSMIAAAAVALAFCLQAERPAAATELMSQAEAIALAFPDCEIDRKSRFLTQSQRQRAAELARVEIDSRLVVQYAAECSGAPGGIAYFDVHRVRTLTETLMVAVDAQGRILRIEVVSFLEPQEYIPRRNWYDLFLGRRLDDELRLKRAIHGVSGATLTVLATTDAARRILALDQVLREASP